MTPKEIFTQFQEEKQSRIKSGWSEREAGALAIEDTAWMLDLSIADVCRAISLNE
jgi:hypothetical protein